MACTPEVPWWKGNLHMHSLWSDGDQFPEVAIGWYRERGYDFVALSDHNTLAQGERWVTTERAAVGPALERYLDAFGSDWVEQRDSAGLTLVRLKTLDEYRGQMEVPDTFLVIPAEEISDRFESKPIHVNATNLAELIAPQGGASVLEVMQNNVDAVLEQRRRLDRPIMPHLNHPNFGWAVTVEDLIALEGERFFEVYNGHPLVHNHGDETRPSVERMWDIALAERLARGDEVLYGIAVDDTHTYHDLDISEPNPGRGWVMVRAPQLDAASLIAALEAGDFYGSTGVVLQDVRATASSLRVVVRPEPDVTYTVQFIGTRRGYPAATRIDDPEPDAPVRFRYPEEMGTVLAEVEGTEARYDFTGDELYVRAKVISSKAKENPYAVGEREMAWTQPVVVRGDR